MILYVKLEDVIESKGKQLGYLLLGEEQGCVNGCCLGVSVYTDAEYGQVAAHEDQEGFFVLSGYGNALINGEEISLEPGMSFIVPAGVEHVMKSAEAGNECRVLWFHAAI